MQVVKIGGREIGAGCRPYIICEISANHNGSLETALELVEAAARTGCDAIKLQTYTPDTMTIPSSADDFKISKGLWSGRTLYELYSEAHTPFEWHEALFARARELGVQIFSTPFDESAVDLLEALDAPAFKIASFEVTDLPLIRYVARKGKPVIISTGMASLHEISSAVDAVRSEGNRQIILLHCVSSYPAPISDSNVLTVPHLGDTFGVPVGLSDHTMSNAVSVASIVLGGTVIEKHFTLDRNLGGPDASFSLEPEEFKSLVNDCKDAWCSLGQVDYAIKTSEAENLRFRRSIYFVTDLKAGDAVKRSDVRIIRPGFGLPPSEIDQVVGKTVKSDVKRGMATSWEHFE